MVPNNGYNAYAKNKIMTASPAELTLMLYEGAIKFCNIAVVAIENKDYAKINHLKGYCSFALSIEKKGIESCYSDQMMKLLQQRGCNSLKELIEKL